MQATVNRTGRESRVTERKTNGFRKTLLGAALVATFLSPAAAFAGDAPAMWRLKDADSEVYLFGTFHVLPASVQWTTPAFDAAMQETETTITEADVTSPEAQAAMLGLVQKYGLNPQGVTLSSMLGPERAAEIERIAGSLGVPMATLSGRHAAEAILQDRTSTSRSPRTAMPGGTSTGSATAAGKRSASSPS